MARAPRRVVDLAAAGRLQAITSWELLPELEDVLARGLRRSAEAGDPILREVLSYAEVIAPTEEIEVSMCDPADVKVITGALVGRADFIVTGDADLLDLGQVGAVRIIGVAAFLDGRL